MVQVSLKLRPYTLAKLFWNETMLDNTKTGITELDMYVWCKESEVVQSQLSEKGIAAFDY